MTFRAIVIGVIAAVAFGVGGRYVDAYIRAGVIRGGLPVTVYGMLIFFVLVANPLIGLVRKSWRFKASEIAVMLALLLGVSSIIDAGLMRYFPSVCVEPLSFARTQPSWDKSKVMSYVPRELMVNDCNYSQRAVEDYITPGDPIAWPQRILSVQTWFGSEPNDVKARAEFASSWKKSWERVDWYDWRKPAVYWGSMISLVFVAVIGLSVVVHRQWARREKIRYPLAEIANTLVLQDENGKTTIFQNKLFWVGLLVPLFIGILKTISLWYPNMITIPLSFDFPMLKETYPKFMQTTGAENLGKLQIYPAVVGLTFLLASDIGFSLGVACPIAVSSLYFMISMGVDMNGNDWEGSPMAWHTFGGYVAFTLMLIYVGRRYYWQTAVQACTCISQEETEPEAVWGLRVFVLCVAAVVGMLMYVGLAWHIALAAVLVIMMGYVVMARMNAEAGAFFFKPSWFLPGIFMGMYGFSSMGPSAYLIIGLLGYIFIADSFECLMPFAVNGLKTASDTGVKTGRMGLLLGITVVLTLLIGIPTALWTDYQNQAYTVGGRYSHQSYVAAERQITKLTISGELNKVNNYTAWERLKNIRPEGRFLISAALGFGLVLAISAVRLRYTWWPLHPLIIVMFGSFGFIGKYGGSFLLGWFIKAMVTRLAGASKYVEIRPLMLGIIVGDLGSGFVTTCVLWTYYFWTGMQGPTWRFW
jgi:hypothetical protein